MGSEADYAAGLLETPDIILAGDSLPGFNNLRALEMLYESGLVIPFIVLSAAFGEEEAVEFLKRGPTIIFGKTES